MNWFFRVLILLVTTIFLFHEREVGQIQKEVEEIATETTQLRRVLDQRSDAIEFSQVWMQEVGSFRLLMEQLKESVDQVTIAVGETTAATHALKAIIAREHPPHERDRP